MNNFYGYGPGMRPPFSYGYGMRPMGPGYGYGMRPMGPGYGYGRYGNSVLYPAMFLLLF